MDRFRDCKRPHFHRTYLFNIHTHHFHIFNRFWLRFKIFEGGAAFWIWRHREISAMVFIANLLAATFVVHVPDASKFKIQHPAEEQQIHWDKSHRSPINMDILDEYRST